MRLAVLALLSLLAAPALATTYEVGPGKTYATPSAVPWESLVAGDTVLIYWRSTPYTDKWVICRQGQAGNPITVRGVPGAGGELPVIEGSGAVTRTQLNYWNEERGLLKIGGANTPADLTPQYIVIESLDLKSARPPYTFTGRNGLTAYDANAAAIYVEKGEHITIRNCVIRDSGNGLFAAAATTDLVVEGNWIYDNGNVGSIYEHNNYTEVLGITFQYNHFGPLRAGCDGNNLKDRSAGTVIRYNWIESGNRQLDLVDAEDSAALVADPSYHSTWVYGNVLVEPDGAGNSQIIHYGGDSGTTGDYRKGMLYLYNNTVVSTRSGNTTLLRLSTNEEHADVRNNVLFVTAAGGNLSIIDDTGTADLRANWLKTGWVACHGTPTGTVNDLGGQVLGTDPGFASLAGQDFHLTGASACRDAAGALATGAYPVGREYVKHQQNALRYADGALDIGAYEYCASGCAVDGGVQEDAGTPQQDASPQQDVGLQNDSAPEDSGPPPDGWEPPDGAGPDGVVPADAGSDAPPAGADAGADGAAGDGGTGGKLEGGCGCRGAGARPSSAWLVAVLLLGARRGRRGRARTDMYD
jgi:hypothetical protein